MEFFGDDDDDVRGYFPIRGRKVDYVWDGWDAALIVSYRKKADQAVNRDIYGTNVPEKEDIARVMSLEECEILLGKRKDSEISKTEWRDSITRQVYLLLQPYQKKEEDSHLIDLSFRKGRPKDYYCDREREAYEAFPSSTMEGGDSNWLFMIAKEDFERIYELSIVKDECSTYYSNLCHAHCDPCVVIAEGKVKVEKFSTLREHDICDIIQQCQGCAENKGFEVYPWAFPFDLDKWDDISQSDIISAIREVLKYVPLKLIYFQEAIIFPISRGSFGPCTDELRGVINIADNERRMQCQRFISVQHILFGLSLSRVGDNVRMLNDRPRCSGGLHSKLSMFSIYKLSRIAADGLGDKEVGLEHLVLAIFFGKQEDDPIKRVELEYGSSLFFDDNAFDPELVDCEKQRLLLFFGESILHNGYITVVYTSPTQT